MDKKLRIEKIRQACVYKNKVIRIHKLIRIITLIATALSAILWVLVSEYSNMRDVAFFVLGFLIVIILFVVWRNESTKETNSFLAQKDIVNLVVEHTFSIIKEEDATKTFGNTVYFKSLNNKNGIDIQISVCYNGYDINEKTALKEKIQQELKQVEQSVANVTNLKIDVVI